MPKGLRAAYLFFGYKSVTRFVLRSVGIFKAPSAGPRERRASGLKPQLEPAADPCKYQTRTGSCLMPKANASRGLKSTAIGEIRVLKVSVGVLRG